jgi:hypothetical protein
VSPLQVAYFAANMLLTKVRLEWSTLSPQQRSAVSSSVSQALLHACSPAGSPALPARRLCLVLAAAGARSPPAEAVVLVQHALDLGARGSVAVALLVLKSLADEADEAPRAKRAALLAAISPACQPVLQLAEHAAGSPSTVGDAMCAALSWLRLDAASPPGGPLAGGRLLLSPAALAVSVAPGLHSRALACLGCDDEQLVDTASDFLADVHAAGNPRVGAGEEAAAMEATLRALTALGPRAGAPDGEATARAIVRVATTLGERHTEALVAGASDWLALVSLVINTVAVRRERACMAACSDLLLRIADTPLAARHPQLREPLFTALGARCLAHATLPVSWTRWADAGAQAADDEGDDCDDVQRFREHILADLLQCCDVQLGTPWITSLVTSPLHLDPGDTAQSQPQAWPQVEAALFVLRVCVLGLRGRALGDTPPPSTAAPGDARQQRVASNALLAAVFTRIAADGGGGGMLSSHACVVEASCRLVGAYATWLGKCPQGQPLVQGITAYLLRALRVPDAVPHAAEALRNVCARAGDVLTAQPAVLSSLIATAHMCLPQPSPPPQPHADGESPPVDECAAVVEGLARLVARLPPADACGAALALVGPILERCSQRLACGDVSSGAVFSQACDLGLVASAIRFVDAPATSDAARNGAQDTPAAALMRAAWPMLSRQGESGQWRGSAPAMAALCAVYTRALASCKAAAAPMVTPVLMCVLTAFEERPQGCHLDVLTSAVEVFTPSGGATAQPRDVDGTLDAAMARAASVTHALVERGAASHEVVRALCECAHRCALFAPAALLRPDTLNAVLRVACHALAMTERDPVAQGALLLRCLISPGRQMAVFGDTWRAAKPAVDAGMQQLGRHVMNACCVGAVVGSQGGQLLCHVVYDLLRAYPAAAPDWLASVILDAGFPPTEAGMAPGRVEETHKRLFLQLALQSPPLTSQRFDALFTDWTRLCRREGDADTLLAYQM